MRLQSATAGVMLALAAGLTTSATTARHDPVAQFSARTVEMAGQLRPSLRRVDIVVREWTTDVSHRRLARTMLEKGPVAFADALCGFPSVGSIVVAGHREFTIRYAWQTADRDGGQHVYLATDEPISLGAEFRRFSDEEPLTFVELRLDRHGDGIGKMSDAVRLSVDESRNVIELRDFERRAAQLIMVRDELLE